MIHNSDTQTDSMDLASIFANKHCPFVVYDVPKLQNCTHMTHCNIIKIELDPGGIQRIKFRINSAHISL